MIGKWHAVRAANLATSPRDRRKSRRYRLEALEGLENRLVLTASSLSVAAATGIYGGTAHLSATLISASVPLANEPVDFHLGSTDLGVATTNASGVASISAASLGSLAVGGYSGEVTGSFAGDSSYSASNAANGLTVTKAALTIKAVNQTETYGQAPPTLTATYTGFVNGDTAASLTSPVSLSTTATSASPVAHYPITASGASSNNYTISYTGGSDSVTPPFLTVTPANIVKPYGVAVPTLTATYSGFVNGDTIAIVTTPATLSTTATTNSTFGNYTITSSGGSAANYTIVHGHGTVSVPSDPTNTAFITSLYQCLLGRNAEVAGSDGWLAALNNGASKLAVISAIYNSSEAATFRTANALPTYANGPEQIAMITGLYETIIDRNSESIGLNFWLAELNTGAMNAEQVAAGIYNSPEAVTDRAAGVPRPTQDQAVFLVTSLYQVILDRNPEPQGLGFWVGWLTTGGEDASWVTSGIYNSVEAVHFRSL